MTPTLLQPSQAAFRNWIVRLQLITIGWMIIESGVAAASAWKAHSPALVAFGADSFVELLSGLVVLLQFTSWFTLRPSVAARVAGILLFVLAAIVTAVAAVSLVTKQRPEASWGGMIITVAALLVMPWLSRAKRKAAQRSGNRALAADAVQSATCSYLAAITLVGLTCNALFRIGWLDPVAALLAVPVLCIEAKRAIRGDSCGCC